MKRKYSKIIKKIAKQNGISEEEVYSEMKKAIEVGQHNPDPVAQAFWEKVAHDGINPTPEKVIELISNSVKK